MTVPPILTRIARGLLAVVLLGVGSGPALAQGTLDWVEVGLVLDGAGRARVTYQVRWRTSGTMHGFYFQGEAATPHFRGGAAELPDGLAPSDTVVVMPEEVGSGPVAGELLATGVHEIAVRRTSQRAGELVVHFPREDYMVVRA